MDSNYIVQMLEQAGAFEQSNQLDLAQNIYNVALQLLPDSETKLRAQILRLRGSIAYRLNNKAGAMDDIRKAMELDPEMAASFSGDFSKFYNEGCH